ncbi:hypothetical protein [Frankia sp. CiP3]|uniref:hypothetical protein n=1 Tax=Frankia sp. CiP3 TaxID=2880971 RepID=UPI001EF624A7|nr:hypothetical protein [Frankia sp. CiP3]
MDHATRRYCRCGTRLARDNTGGLCGPCQRTAQDRILGAPVVPEAFWDTDQLRDAFDAWHMGHVIAAYRAHPYHGIPLSQETVAGWMDLTQAQLSRIEAGPPPTDLARLMRWAACLRIPDQLLWFRMPGPHRTAQWPAALTDTRQLPATTGVPEPTAASQPPHGHAVRDLHWPEDVIAALRGESWSEPSAFPADGRPVAVPPTELAHDDFVGLFHAWATTVRRRQFLLSMGRAATAAATIPLVAGSTTEPDRLLGALGTPSRVDAAIIGHIEDVLHHAQRQDDALGPQAVLRTVLDQRRLARHLLEGCPPDLRPRLLSVYADLCRATGQFIFDLGQFKAAMPHLEKARAAAHEARNTELGAFTLCQMAHAAIWQGHPRMAVDYASAAVAWAWRTPDRALQANTGDMAARAYAAAGEYDACMAELDRAAGALALRDDRPSLSYWYDEAFLASIRGQCLLHVQRPAEALAIIGPSVATLDPALSVRNLAMTMVDLGSAYIQHGEIEEAARALGQASELAVRNRSVRLAIRLRDARQQLEPWTDTPAVRELDETMAVLRVVQEEAL